MIIVNTTTSYFFTNLHAIYVWNGHRERRSRHWYLQLHTRLAERFRWRCADLHSDWFHAVMTQSPFSVQFIEKILNRCKYLCFKTYHVSYCLSPNLTAPHVFRWWIVHYCISHLWSIHFEVHKKVLYTGKILPPFYFRLVTWGRI